MVGIYVLIIVCVVVLLLKSQQLTTMKFKMWCKNNNVRHDGVDVGYQGDLRGLYTTKDIQIGDLLIELPLESCINERVRPDITTMEEDYTLAKKLRDCDTWNSKYKGYINFLPKRPHLIADWSDDEIEKLNYRKAYELREKQKNENDLYPGHMKRYLDLVRSRRIIFRYDDHNLLLMLPFIDMINHDESSDGGSFEFDIRIEGDTIKLYSTRNYGKGDQVVLSYGDSKSEMNSTDHHLTRHGIFINQGTKNLSTK